MAWVTKDSGEQYSPESEPQKQYTKGQQALNWWHYHKWIVLGCAVGVVVLGWIAKDTLLRTKPDYQVAYIGLQDLPVDTSENLTEALQLFGEDLNGDGKVVVQFNQYTVDFDAANDSTDAYNQMAGVTQLSADLSSKDGSYIFLLEDPAAFEKTTGALQYLDGTLPADTEADDFAPDWQNMVYRWADCPALTALDLGDYRGYTLMDSETGSNQSVLENVYVACRGYAEGSKTTDRTADVAMWNAMTAGAQKLPEATK